MKTKGSYKELCENLLDAVGESNVKSFIDFSFHKSKDFAFDISSEQVKGKKSIIIRHDVDFNPVIARDLAKVEKETGVKSTFFALYTHSAEKWWVDKENRKKFIELFLEIQEMGHEVGLHYDFIGDYFRSNKDPKENAIEILSILRSSGLKIRGCAAHGSGISRHGLDFVNYMVWGHRVKKEKVLKINSQTLKIPCMDLEDHGLLYEGYSVRRNWYLSDSGNIKWQGGKAGPEQLKGLTRSNKNPDIIAKEDMEDGEIMQILVHPIWWKNNLK